MLRDDIICALSTPQGVGALGIIRLSGTNSSSLLTPFFCSVRQKREGWTSHVARGYLARMTNIKQTFNLRSEMPLSLSSVDCGRVCFCELATSTAAFLFAECTATM